MTLTISGDSQITRLFTSRSRSVIASNVDEIETGISQSASQLQKTLDTLHNTPSGFRVSHLLSDSIVCGPIAPLRGGCGEKYERVHAQRVVMCYRRTQPVFEG